MPVRCAHPSFRAHWHAKRGAARPPACRSFAVSYSTPKNIYKIYRTWAAHVKGFFLSTGPQRLLNRRSPVPRPAHRSFAASLLLPGNIFGVTIISRCALIFWFFLFSIVFRSFLFVILFFFFSPFQLLLILLFFSLLILLVITILSLLILFSSYILTGCWITGMHINDIHISVILRGFQRGPSLFFIHLGSKLMHIPVRPYVVTFFVLFFLFFSSYTVSSYSSLLYYNLRLLILLFLYLNCFLYYRHAYKTHTGQRYIDKRQN